MWKNILDTVLNEIVSSVLVELQLDESTNVASDSQLVIYVRYIKCDELKEGTCSQNHWARLYAAKMSFDQWNILSRKMSCSGRSWWVFVQQSTIDVVRSFWIPSISQRNCCARNYIIHRYDLAVKILPPDLVIYPGSEKYKPHPS